MESPGQNGFTREFYQIFREEKQPTLKISTRLGGKKEETLKVHFFRQQCQKKKKRPICSILCIKFLDKILAKGVCVCVFHKLQGLLQKCKAGSTFKSSQTIHHINRLQKKSRMITSAEREKVFDKIQHQFIMKALCKLGGKPTKLGFKTSV